MVRRRLLQSLAALLVLLSSCHSAPGPTPSASGGEVPSSPVPNAGAALVPTLPEGCAETSPPDADTVAFVASGRAWAVAPDGTGLTCLFPVAGPGPFLWGPRGDRVALAGLEVRGVGGDVARPPSGTSPVYLSWGRPTGKAILFSAGSRLEKVLLGRAQVQDITPFDGTRYRDVAYHPSGLAIAFAIDGAEGSAIWLSSNTGTDPKRLVWSKSGTVFGALAFDLLGDGLFYGARLANGTRLLARLSLREGRVEEGLWKGDRDVLRVVPVPPDAGDVEGQSHYGAALDVGSGCADQQAIASSLDGSSGTPLVPDATRPTTTLGWLDPVHAVVAQGGCTGPSRLWVTQGFGATPKLLVDGVDRGAVRVPEPTPAPPLPDLGVTSEFA